MRRMGKTVGVVAACLLGGVLLLGANAGSEVDPLVTLSYLRDVLTPDILKKVDSQIETTQEDYMNQLNESIDDYQIAIDEKLSQAGAGDVTLEETSVFQTVTLTNGQTLSLNGGGEFLLRTGTATCAATPEMIDSTLGESLVKGGAVVSNHLYLVMAEGKALTATSDVTLLVRGTYSLS